MKKLFLILFSTSILLSACQNQNEAATQKESHLEKKVYIAVENDHEVAVVDPGSGLILKRIELSGMPHNIQVSPDGETVWTTVNSMSGEEDQLVVISAETEQIIETIKLGTDLHLAHVVLSPDKQWAYATAQEQNEIFVVNAKTYRFEKTIELPAGAEPHGLRIDPQGDFAYLALMGAKGMGILNLKTEAFELVNFEDAVVQTGVTLNGEWAFASLYSTKKLGLYNLETKTISKIALPEAKGPVQVYATPNSRYVYVADQGFYFDQPTNNKVYKVDLESQEVVTTITAGEGPHGVAVSKDGLELYVTNIVSGNLSIIDTKTNQILKTIEIGNAPNGVSVWEQERSEASVSLTEVDKISHSHGIAVAIDDPSKLYIATHEGLLVLKEEKDLYRIGKTTNDLMGFTINSKDPLTFYASGHPSSGGNSGFQKTTDGGETWNKVSDGMDGPVDFHAMTISPVNADIIYGYFHSKIQKSADGGKTWTLLENHPESIFSLVADKVDDQTLYATTKQGIWVSKDGGKIWTILSESLASSAVLNLVQNPLDANQMLSFSNTLGLASSKDAGKTWTSIKGAPNTIFYFITYSPKNPELVYALDERNKIHKSTDSGVSWQKIY